MTYKQFIQNILDTRGRFSCGSKYCERHHIIPKCMGGTDAEDNLIDLFAREHFIAHRLLALENPNNKSLVASWWCMCYLRKNNINQEICTPEEYEEARINFSNSQKGRIVSQETRDKIGKANKGHSVSLETRQKISKKLTGTKLSEETKQKLSIIGKKNFTPEMKQKLIEANKNKIITQETKDKISQSKKGKKFSEEHKKNLSKAKQRKQSPRKGQHLTEEQKLKLSIPVNQYDMDGNFIKSWVSATIAMQELNIHKSNITACCKKRKKSAGGFIWKYAEEEFGCDVHFVNEEESGDEG